MSSIHGNGIWKHVAVALISSIVGVAIGSWNKVSADKVADTIRIQAVSKEQLETVMQSHEKSSHADGVSEAELTSKMAIRDIEFSKAINGIHLELRGLRKDLEHFALRTGISQ